ncbi:insulinase family protein [Terriglobus albidus]|uniref:Insulinase family protein n=1 Tax=Terriglobus albidus TaxID=1592106 RepID=A0A5B9EAT0_9BACT|nr:pitrilysin family protein [Terriglobus albidus]QEE29268.1 insulinase family protein [Terriglobus albidus]
MKKNLVCLALASALIVPAFHAQTTEPWTKIPTPPLHEFKPVQPKRIDLKNGVVIFLQEDHELPFIDGTINIRGGSREEPANKAGMLDMYGDVWRTSGTAAMDGDAMDDALEAKAAKIETSADIDSTALTWSSLKTDFDTVFPQTIDLLLHPSFKPEKLELAQQQMATGIARRNDDAGGILAREVGKVVYGAASPYARQPEFSTVLGVTADDLKQWHDKTVVGSNLLVSVIGDFDSATMEKKLRDTFEKLPKGEPFKSLKGDFPGPKPGVYFVNKDDVNQSNISIAGLGTMRNNPDLYALSVMNEIFSGGFGSRLTQSVRTKLGLAYAVGGGYGATYDHPGIFRVQAGTKSASTVAATKAMLEEINRLKSVPPTETELRNAREQLLNSFIFRYDSRAKVLSEQVMLAFYGYPADFLEKYKAGIEKVTAADVSRVAAKYIDTSKLAIVVVGNSGDLGSSLKDLGPVTDVDITIPPPPAGMGN